jgi:hypothetical protein
VWLCQLVSWLPGQWTVNLLLVFFLSCWEVWRSQGSTLGPLYFNIFKNIDDFFIFKYLLLADDLKIYRNVINVPDRECLQSNTNCLQNRCFENGMIPNVGYVHNCYYYL